MFGRRRKPQQEREDPAVAEIEQILSGAAPRSSLSDLQGRPNALNALWICACITTDASPTWLIYDRPDDDLAWQRVPDGTESPIWSGARSSAAGHAYPVDVLRWLRQEAPDPWGTAGDGFGDPGVTDHLRAMIINRRA